ncbi:glycogen synthase kinase binding protein [Salarias fasciatus]|uniref:GSK-3-binding protein-like n=1 Tax=Salarias fasciatus TaxID=181472 RepID=A0A672FPB3_SALFA|nr:GSK-3-binding protein-like [Salarias fasciatus]
MPCRKENYLLLEQSVSVSPKEVDALVARIGEALQLHGNTGGHPKAVSRLHGLNTGGAVGVKPVAGISGGAGAQTQKRPTGPCVRIRTRGHHLRVGPYSVPAADGERRDWEQIRPWSKKRRPVEEDDPHRLLQDLILSGNLIKEAVRRLQFSADCGDFPRPADSMPC